jgi:DNA-binding transcriptional LysR family regulator
MDPLDVHGLRVFVTVADLGSFSAAARELNTTQPTVSRTVDRLETNLGVALVHRTTRCLSLTPAGEVFLREARRALDQVGATVALTRRAATRPGRLVLAVKPDGDAGLLATALPTFEAAGQPVDLILRETPDLAPAVRTGLADVCLVGGPVDLAGLDHELVLTERRFAVLPTDHRLAHRDVVDLDDLVDDAVLRWPHLPAGLDRFYQGLRHDDEPRAGTAPVAADLAEALRLVELGRAVTFLPDSVVRRFAGRRIVSVPVVDLAPSALDIAWRPNSRDLVLARFIEHIHAAARGAGAQTSTRAPTKRRAARTGIDGGERPSSSRVTASGG